LAARNVPETEGRSYDRLVRPRALRCFPAVVGVASLLASTALADEEYPRVEGEDEVAEAKPPAGYHRETRIREDLLLSGTISFGVAYLSNALSSIALVSGCSTMPVYGKYSCGVSQSTAQALLFIPVAGPFIGLSYGNTMATNIFLVLGGVSQAIGLGTIVASLLWRRTIFVRDQPGRAATYVGPMSVGTGTGLGLVKTW
jgi:hypothetical protein